MPDTQSIEDLIARTGAKAATATPSKHGEETAAEKLQEKLGETRLKELESEAEKGAVAAGIQYVNLKGFPISPDALIMIPKEQAEQFKAVCFLFTGEDLRVGAVEPNSQGVKDLIFQLTERHKAKGGAYKISEESFRVAMKAYEKLPKILKIVKGVKVTDEELQKFQSELKTFEDLQRVMKGASITDIVTILMAAGLEFGTSDIHIEAEKEEIAVRFRIDGVLQQVASLPHELWKKMISRIKLISGLKINIVNRPQDGRFTIFLKSGDTDVRVSTIPTTWGESVVMRILKPAAINVEFSDLGWRPIVGAKLTREIEKPHGMIVTTGPTGSGKTTTLYSILRKLNTPERKIITLEDPIEYKLKGINQSQINPTKQYTFAKGLRSILRQDPDVVMVGEIRDLETAEVAIEAALTGHLMLSTLHTNDAAGALPRFLSMGVKPFLLSPALNAIIGQRLTRRIHADCKQEVQLTPEQMAAAKKILAAIPENSGEIVPPETEWKFYKGGGCEICNNSGYKGRIGIYELLLMDENIRASLSEKISEYEVRQLAKKQGMVTMQQDGLLKALAGLTTVEEVLRVAGEGI